MRRQRWQSLAVRLLARLLVPQRLHERGHVAAVLRRELIDAGDQQVTLLIASLPLPLWGLVVVVQPGGLRGGGANGGYRHVESLGERVNGGRAWWPDQGPGAGQAIHRRTRRPRPPGAVAIGPPPIAAPSHHQASQPDE